MCTRSEVSEPLRGDDEGMSIEAVLHSALDELKKMREERVTFLQRQEEIATLLRLRDEELLRLREAQLSLSINIPRNGADCVNVINARMLLKEQFDFKIKLDVFEGSVPLREFFSQFNFIACTNNLDERAKAVSCFEGKARSVLECFGSDVSNVNRKFINLEESGLALGNCRFKYLSEEILIRRIFRLILFLVVLTILIDAWRTIS